MVPMGLVISSLLLVALQPCQSADSFIRSPFKVIDSGSFIPYRPYGLEAARQIRPYALVP